MSLAAAGCGDDDDTGPGGTAGRGGSSQGGSANNLGGDGSLGGDRGLPGGGGTLAGTSGRGGTTSGGTTNGGATNGGATNGGATMEDSGGAGAVGGAGGEGGAAPAIADLTDAQILLVLDTLNQGEVEEAYAALPRLSEPDVETFAQAMITDHGSARQAVATTADTLDLTPAPSSVQRKLMRESEAHVAELRSTADADIDETYIDHQVMMHAEALALLEDLDESADATELRTLIATLTASVQDHHDSAVAIQDEL